VTTDILLLDAPAGSASGEDLRHVVCCDDDVALCGLDVSGDDWSGEGPVCVPCEIEWKTGPPCPAADCVRR
jgi:hypothetical protein